MDSGEIRGAVQTFLDDGQIACHLATAPDVPQVLALGTDTAQSPGQGRQGNGQIGHAAVPDELAGLCVADHAEGTEPGDDQGYDEDSHSCAHEQAVVALVSAALTVLIGELVLNPRLAKKALKACARW